MLSELTVKNMAVLEDVRLNFGPGLTVLTGETGAGKSVIVGALGLALGRRAEAGFLRQGADRLTVTARFQGLGATPRALLAQTGLEAGPEDEVLLRRDVDRSGRSRAFINDQPVSAATLARLGERLVFAHGQHDHQLLLEPAEQRGMVDSFGQLAAERDSVSRAWALWKETADRREALDMSERDRAQRLDVLRFQKKELDDAAVRAGEDEELESLLLRLKNADRLTAAARRAREVLHARDGSVSELVRQAREDVEALAGWGAPVREIAELLNEVLPRVEEAAQRLDTWAGAADTDPARLDEVISRLDRLARLKRKYGPTLADVAAYGPRVSAELDTLERADDQRREMDMHLDAARADLARLCSDLSQSRRRAAERLAAAARGNMRDVGLERAVFSIRVTTEERFSSTGTDRVEFFLAANPGEGERPLREVASGGELSRLMLALESAASPTEDVPVLVFDEIDAGVGGRLGAALGKKLASLAVGRQAVCVTHLATIAAWADAHMVVEKEVQGQRTRTRARTITGRERVAEIARMVGGGDSTPALQHARELLAVRHRAEAKELYGQAIS